MSREVLDGLVAWASWVPDFTRSHAADGLFIATGYRKAGADLDDAGVFYIALMLGFWFWLDDRTDQNLDWEEHPVAWDNLIAAASGEIETSHTPEEEFLRRLSVELKQRATSFDEYRWWRDSVRFTIEGFREEEKVSRERRLPVYSEYIEMSYWSSAVSNLLAIYSLLSSGGMAERRADPWLMRLERYLCLVARLQNDLHSAEKERREQCLANAVIVMSDAMPEGRAREFVAAQVRSYEQMLYQTFATLGSHDPFVKFAKAMLRAHEQWYEHSPKRYAGGE